MRAGGGRGIKSTNTGTNNGSSRGSSRPQKEEKSKKEGQRPVPLAFQHEDVSEEAGGGGRTTPLSAILPLLVQTERPRKEAGRLGAVYGASFFRNRCFTGSTWHCSSEGGGQVIKTGADRHRKKLKGTEEEERKSKKGLE